MTDFLRNRMLNLLLAAENGGGGGEGGDSGTDKGGQGQAGAAPGGENGSGGTDGAEKDKKPPEGKEEPLTREAIEKMIQSAEDRVRTEYSRKLSAAEEELEEVRKKSMTDQERKDYELQKKEKALREKEQAILKSQVELAATDALTELEMPLSFRPFVIANSPEETKDRVGELQKVWTQALDDAVKKRFQETGRNPRRAGSGTSVTSNMNEIFRQSIRGRN